MAIKERSITHYLDHRSKEIMERSEDIVRRQREWKQQQHGDRDADAEEAEEDPHRFCIDEAVCEQ